MSLKRVAIVAVLTATAIAHADDADKSEAQHLFDEGRQLLTDGKTDDACAKFELSIAKDPRAVGTLLNLGLCNERRGKPATALALFQEAYDRATEANLPQHRDAAQEHIALLVPQVPVLALAIPTATADETIIVDDKAVKLVGKTLDVKLDPGPHRVVASAPGRLPFETQVSLAINRRTQLAIPALELPRTVVEQASSRRLYGKVATFGGAGLLAIAVGMDIYAYRSYHAQFDDMNCRTIDGARLCNPHGHDVTTRARTISTAGTIVGTVGLVAVAAGVALWLTAPTENRGTQLVPTAAPDGAGVSLVGRF